MDPHLDQRLSELMRRAQQGDRHAYEALLTEVAALVRTFVRRRIRQGDPEDIVQDALLSIHRNRHTYDPERPFLPWMYAIARHRLLDAVRKERRRGENEVGGMVLDDLRSEDARVDQGPSGFVQRALALLSPNQREVIQMLKVEDRSVAEIATRTGLSVSSVKVSAHRAYVKLRKLISRPARDE